MRMWNKHWKKILITVGVCAIALVLFSRLSRIPFLPGSVVKIEVQTWDDTQSRGGHFTLDEEEMAAFLKLYRTSRYGGKVTGEPGTDSYRFILHFWDGTTLQVTQGGKGTVIVRPNGFLAQFKKYYLENRSLIYFIYDLAEDYESPITPTVPW